MARDTKKIVQSWLNGPYDDETKKEIKRLQKEDPTQLEDAFYKDLSFGTGGMRGIMGVGTNRLNIYNIGKATQGLANYINDVLKTSTKPCAVICYDSRHNSKTFAFHAARVLAGNNIHVYVSPELRPTPFTSFMVRRKEASAGIMITASHNPPEYNGYKVYGPDGAQVVPPHDTGIVDAYHAISSLDQIKLAPEDSPLIHLTTEEDDDAFIMAIKQLQVHPKEASDFGNSIKIDYSSLHGAGITLIEKAFNAWGLTDIHMVKKQVIPDGDFPTIKKPNPEELPALKMGMEQMAHEHADLFIANDPDADRVGVVCMHKDKPVPLNGNEVATICLYHLANTMQQKGHLTRNHTAISTIVSTRLLKKIADDFKMQYYDVLTGFKYIGEKIHQFEQEENPHQFLFGAEESYGYLIGTHSRDKDAMVSSALIGQIALHLKLQGLTLIDLLHDIYQLYGVHREGQALIQFEDTEEGAGQRDAIMKTARDPKLTSFDDVAITSIEDYKSGTRHDLITNEKTPLDLPKSDVMLYSMEDDTRIVIRPSGTEPKVKIYGLMTYKSFNTVDEGIEACNELLEHRLKVIKKHLTG